MALEIAVPPLPCPPRGWCEGLSVGGSLGQGLREGGRNVDGPETCLGRCFSSLGALVKRDAF